MNKTEYTSNIEDHLGYWLRCLSNFVSSSFEKKLSNYDISVAQWVILRILFENSGITLNLAAQLVGVDKSSLSRLVERLVQRGLINRTEGNDRRSIELSLTVTGKELVPKLAILADENDDFFFKTLTNRQKKDLLLIIQTLLTANGWKSSNNGDDRIK